MKRRSGRVVQLNELRRRRRAQEFQPRRRRRSFRGSPVRVAAVWKLALVLAAAAFGLQFAAESGWSLPLSRAGEPIQAAAIRVIDGDTLDIGGERVRISNLDAPEMPGRASCPSEEALALSAKLELSHALTRPGAQLELHRDQVRRQDRFGRTLGRITVDGKDVGGVLIRAGVARRWTGQGSDWCGRNR